VGGAIGYFAMTIHTLGKTENKVMMVHNIQQRMLPQLPKRIQKQYARWREELLRVVEEECRQKEINTILIFSEKNYASAYRPRYLLEYASFEKKLDKNGYVLRTVHIRPITYKGSERETFTRQYWVKHLQ
jgi:hypothetical protein